MSNSNVGAFIGNIPLLVIPWILYHLFALGGGDTPINVHMDHNELFWHFTKGNLIVLIAICVLYVEIYKSTRTGQSSIIDHVVSMILFIIALLELILMPKYAGTSSYFLLMMIMLVDVVGGFTITIRGARRDFGAGGGGIPMG